MPSTIPPDPQADAFSKTPSRRRVLRRHGATPSDVDALLQYGENAFAWQQPPSMPLPLPDDASAKTWATYADAAASEGMLPTLQRHIVQLRFPVRSDVAESEAYRRATRALADTDVEALPLVDGGISLDAAAGLRLQMTPTIAGCVPVMIAGSRADFLALYRAILKKSNPEAEVPSAVGAVMIAGYTNWSRIHNVRRAGKTAAAPGPPPLPWPERFTRDPPPASQYKDRFILLSPSPYSGVPACDMGLDDATWAQQSVTIRAEHEAAHYVTQRLFGSMQNALHDELIADYMGLTAVRDTFDADAFLRFMGLENYPEYRSSGRLGAYRGTPALPDSAFEVLKSLAVAAARTIESVDRAWRQTVPDANQRRIRMLFALTHLTVEDLASDRGATLLNDVERQTRMLYTLTETDA